MPVEYLDLRITINDVRIYGAISVIVEQASYFRASRFCVKFAVGDAPLMNIASYALLSAQTITIELADTAFGYANMLTGQIDNVVIDCIAGTATLSGRDLSAWMIDSEISESFVNQTASEVVASIAAKHNLNTDIIPTVGAVGQYYELDHARTSLQLHSRAGNEWDLLVWLAQSEGNFLTIIGKTVYFGPIPAAVPVPIFKNNCMEITVDIALTLPQSAIVKSWNTRNKAALMQVVGSGANTTTLVKPNLSTKQAQDMARSHLAALSQHATILRLKMPGELNLMPAIPIYLSGTESSLDQLYMIEEIIREIDVDRGFVQTVHAYALN